LRISLAMFATSAPAAACKDERDPDDVAASFVDAYFLEVDFERAQRLADGEALARIREEQKAAGDIRKQTPIDQAKSRVYYGKPEKSAVGDTLVNYTYALEVHSGSDTFDRSVVVMLARRGEVWRVIKFREQGPRFGDHFDREPVRGAGATLTPDRDGVRTGTASGAANAPRAPAP
jgi:hypothetical protein